MNNPKVMLLVLTMSVGFITKAQLKPLIIREEDDFVEVRDNAYFIDSIGSNGSPVIVKESSKWQQKVNTPVLQVKKGNVWVKFSVVNKSLTSFLFLDVQYANITKLTLFRQVDGQLVQMKEDGNGIKFNHAVRTSTNFIFPLNILPNDTATYFLRSNSFHPLLLPSFIRKEYQLRQSENLQVIIIGLYVGILFAMFFYNLFLFASTFDKSYLIYILFLLFLGLAQLTVSGYTFKYLWPGFPLFNKYALVVTSALAGIAGISFGIYFLHIKHYMPAVFRLLLALIVVYIASIILTFAGGNFLAYEILNINGLLGGVLLLAASWHIARKGYKPAYFYLVAWVSFLVGMVAFVFRNLNVLPNNYVTTYILYVGSAIEAILLSIALADKINVLRREKEVSQAAALKISQENEQLVREQNVVLEQKVYKRTEELQLANIQLTDAFGSLKDAQLQLVEAEKMASLGQLTAGIAHEINNPINFVKANIKPLLLDIEDLFKVIDEYGKLHENENGVLVEKLKLISSYRQEIDIDFVRSEIYNLMKGIEDGADRTAEIVRGLRNFSRLDESQLKTVNLHEGIESTLVLLRNIVPENFQLVKDFKADGDVECFPGKLNQVFMNILSNSIQAIKSKTSGKTAENIIIKTRDVNSDEVEISIKDSGPGMTPEVKQKIFDPFFTTKEVGEGTGLGLAIVFKIIQEHHGKIDVISQHGEGAEFIITLHRTIPMKIPV